MPMRKSLAPGHQTAARREASTRQWTRRRVGCSLFLVSVVCFSLLLHASQSVASLSSNLSAAPTAVRISLHDNWKIQNSELVSAGGQAVSTSPFDTQTWTPATVPSTVLANLAGPGLGQGGGNDPFAGMNWLKLPGSGAYYPLGKNYGEVETPPESPFGHAWWYRTQFLITQDQLLLFTDLHLKGVTYGAEIWLNGKKVADSDFTKGTYRQFRFDVTSKLKPGLNTLAILVSPPSPTDLTANWVDWNPTPQDKNMGLWREVFLSLHGPVELHRPFVASEIHLPQADQADLTLEVEATNSSPNAVTGLLHTHVMGHHLTEVITLQGHETKMLSLTAQKFPELRVKNPELWWPWQMGQPHLNHASMSFEINRTTSSTLGFEFGIRKIESVLMPNGTEHGSRLFLVNGKPIFIRGGGWASDLLLRFSESRERFEMAYAKSLGLNTIRLEGRFEPESFLSLADREGMLLMPGWVCCGSWQNDEHWTPDQSLIAQESLRDQLFELRSHASVAAFLYGSDEVPSPVEVRYLFKA